MGIRNATVTLCVILLFAVGQACAEEEKAAGVPTRYGLGLAVGNTYETSRDLGYVQVTGFVLFDYKEVWRNLAPDPLRFKIECNLGATTYPNNRFIGSAGFLALYYLDRFAGRGFRPYIEGGIEASYTDFQNPGQGQRFNFNPQAGIGTEYEMCPGTVFFAALRLSHISNLYMSDQNRGINSLVLVLGRFF
jgi:lipid A 3-O-deacylase